MNRKFVRDVLGLTLVSVLLASCLPTTEPTPIPVPEVSTATPIPPPRTPTLTPLPATPTPQLPTPIAAPPGKGYIVLMLFTAVGKSPDTKAEVTIISPGPTVNKGQTSQGMYRALVPAGNSDIMVVFQSTPQAGYTRRDVAVAEGGVTTVTFAVPAEGILNIAVYTKSGNDAQTPYSFVISSAGEQLLTGGSSYRSDTFTLRTDLTYDVKLTYGSQPGEEIQKTGISVREDKPTEVSLLLPYDEGSVRVLLRAGGKSLSPSDSAQVLVIDPAGKQVASGNYVYDVFTVALRVDVDYKIRVQYKSQSLEKTVRAVAGKVVEQTFDLP